MLRSVNPSCLTAAFNNLPAQFVHIQSLHRGVAAVYRLQERSADRSELIASAVNIWFFCFGKCLQTLKRDVPKSNL